MALSIKGGSGEKPNNLVFEYRPIQTGIPSLPPGAPSVGLPHYSYMSLNLVHAPAPPPVEMPEMDLPRALNYYADYGGCGFWRMIWPEYVLNGYQKMCVSGLTAMVLDLRFYQNLKAIRMQRQATPVQKQFVEELKRGSKELHYRMIYEVDDIVFKEDIPDYNRCKDSFLNQEIIDSIMSIMGIVDEITVTCPFMKEYYQNKTGNKHITVIPNYPPKFWLDGFYSREAIEKRYEKNKKRPRILYSGSGTHIDTMNRTGMNDDFKHVTDAIIKARKKFKFVWKGCYPLVLKPYIDNGDMEYIEWSPLLDYPHGLAETKCNVAFASLQDNIFNRSKSNIKMVEAGGIGLPGAYQDLCTYTDATQRFKTGAELIDQLEYITSDIGRYMRLSDAARKFTEGLWLEQHIEKYMALYNTAWGSKERYEMCPDLIRLNPDQMPITA